ncbi:peptidase domain-containing ABC transporter [Chitinophaga eiseniae]|uniref:Peptidase domain-containing ABC transporter n=1 Tax=Chitinophaga eiseniae TaxID=634771 RepID=A0A847STJ2_9BACT|nr:peptidase domain-containing ABC transporter [Chitinophaga eiseniae]NLR81448.1 peptidase domain-containing ABC transporter [Chitinophaga eiseniae]
MSFTFYRQLNSMDCGAACLRMVAKYYGKHFNSATIRANAGFTTQGVSMFGLSETAEMMGFRTRALQIDFKKLMLVPLPAILHWNNNHFVVLIELNEKKAKIADPNKGIITYNTSTFKESWCVKNVEAGVGTVLILEPTQAFYDHTDEIEVKRNWSIAVTHLSKHKKRIAQVLVTLLISSILQLIFPFFAQSLVDTGINTRNLQYVTIVLIAQLTLTFSATIISFIRNRIQLRISNVLNISLLSDFWVKLTRLPISYFDSQLTGDIIQRLSDNRQIQSFFTGPAIGSVFSVLNFFLSAIILVFYSTQLFLIFLTGTIFYFLWIYFFQKIRRKINYATFRIAAKENNATLQLIQGMQEIRLNNAEKTKRWEWEDIQAKLFKLNFRSLNYSQWQTAGALFINQSKEICITFLVANMVINGQLTFGAMLAIQYIIGQMNGPVQEIISFVQALQDAKISLERLNDVYRIQDEESIEKSLIKVLPKCKDIQFDNLSFKYPGAGNELVLNNISLHIPEGKITAIVGSSGSGKTTLLKLLLKVYDSYEGDLRVGESKLKNISHSYWRSQCGTVLQDGFIFNDTILNNIAVGNSVVNHKRLTYSCNMANIREFIDSLPKGFNTPLGIGGVGISQGQKQRILIARAIYKNPQYLFFDEATNSLDSNNEKAIINNLNDFFLDKTVIVIAHRLSTIRDADKIIVLHNGEIVEEGTHGELIELGGKYNELVRNQMEMINR